MKKLALFLLLSGLFAPLAFQLQAQQVDPDEARLRAYVSRIAGVWADRYDASDEPALEIEPEIVLNIDPALVQGDEVRIIVSEYCRPGLAQFLHFRLHDDRLVYVGASQQGCLIDLMWIDFIEIRYQVQGGDTLLIYEGQEVEQQNYIFKTLVRIPQPPPQGDYWQCGLQHYLLSLLKEGDYLIYDDKGRAVSRDMLFASLEELESLEYLMQYHSYWPMYEEVCVRSDFEVVVLGEKDGYPLVYAIEWEPGRISLYETLLGEGGEDWLPLRKGPLRYMIVPNDHIIRLPDL